MPEWISIIIFLFGVMVVIVKAVNKKLKKDNELFEEIASSRGFSVETIESRFMFIKSVHKAGYKRYPRFDMFLVTWEEQRGKNYVVSCWGTALFLPGNIPDFIISRKGFESLFRKGIRPEGDGTGKDFYMNSKDKGWFETHFTGYRLQELLAEYDGIESIKTVRSFTVPLRKSPVLQDNRTRCFVLITKKENMNKANNIDQVISLSEKLAKILATAYEPV